METQPTRFLLVSGHRLFRECLARRLATGGEAAVREVDDLPAVGKALAGWPADVVVADLPAPDAERRAELRALIGRHPGLRVIVLGGSESDDDYLRWIESGAVGYLLEDSSLDELREAVERACGGELHCPPEVGFRLFSRLGDLAGERRRRERVEALSLSPRELEVLEMIAGRLTNRQIAQRLCLSVYTVKNYVHRILAKLGVRNRKDAVATAFEYGWLRERREGARSWSDRGVPVPRPPLVLLRSCPEAGVVHGLAARDRNRDGEGGAAMARRKGPATITDGGGAATDGHLRLFLLCGRRFFAEAVIEALRGDGGLRVVGVATSPAAALERLGSIVADVVLVDASDGRERALDGVRRLRDAHPQAKLLAFGIGGDLDEALAFAEAGARACLLRGAALGELTVAVHELHRDRTRCPPALAALLAERIRALARQESPPTDPADVGLTHRERQVLGLLVVGLTNKEIAQRLDVAVATVKNHVHSLLAKLGVHRRRDAVRTAYLAGLVDDFLPSRPGRRRLLPRPPAPTAAGGPAPRS